MNIIRKEAVLKLIILIIFLTNKFICHIQVFFANYKLKLFNERKSLMVGAIIYLLLHFVSAFFEPSLFWGLDSWDYYPILLRILLLIFAIILIVLSHNETFIEIIKRLVVLLKRIPFFIWIIILGILLITFSQKLYFLGDGLLRIRNTQAGFMFSPAEPMDTWIHTWLYKILKPIIDISASDIFSIISVLSGILSMIGANFYLKRLFAESYYKRLFIALAVFSCGSVQLFFGYVESYSVMASFVILSMFSSIYHLEKQSFSVSPILFLSLGIIFHPIGIIMLPATFFSYVKLISFRKHKSNLMSFILLFLAFIVPIGFMIILFIIQGYDLSKFLSTAGTGFFLPFFSTSEIYGIFSIEHFNDLMNLIFLTVPAIAGINFIFKKNKFKSKNYLVLSTLLLFLFSLVFKPDLGFSRDWDLFSLMAFPLTLLIAMSIIRLKEDKKKYKYAIIIVIVSFFHTIPWVLNNSNEELSLQRAENLANTHYWSAHSKAILLDELGQYYYDRKELSKALEKMKKAHINEPNERFMYSIGVIFNELGNKDSATAIFEEMKDKGYLPYNVNLFLGNIYFEKNKWEKAKNCYKEVLKINPQNEYVAFNLGVIYYSSNELVEASNYFKIALRLNPNNKETLNYLGQIYFDIENYRDALRVFLKAEVLEPRNAGVNYYISLCYANLGLFDKSLQYLEKSKEYGLDSISYTELRKSVEKKYSQSKY